MSTKQSINIDYIPIIRQVGNLVKLDQVKIHKPAELLSTLKVMYDNPNHTIYDMQNQMTMHFSNNDRKAISFLSPYSYYSSYVEPVTFPHIYTYNEFCELKDEIRASVLKSYDSTLQFYLKQYGESKYEEILADYIQRETSNRKYAYYKKCIHYIDAYYYKKALQECKNQPDLKMYSEESIGWRRYEYVVNSDIVMFVDTNFGYGNSSYFHISLRYKDIDILPYSFVVNYFYADIREIRKCTRNYKAEAENWNFAFNFVEEAVNLATTDQVKFCEEFVRNEINAMMSGLESLVSSPRDYVNKFTTMKNKENPIPYVCIRHINDSETKEYNAYPIDIPIAVMSEKIADAYQLLENLAKLSEVFPFAQKAIERIEEITQTAITKAEKQRDINLEKIKSLEVIVNNLKTELEPLKENKESHDKCINSLYEEQKDSENAIQPYEIRQKYESEHPAYVRLKSRISDIEQKIFNANSEIMARHSFVRRMEECLKLR